MGSTAQRPPKWQRPKVFFYSDRYGLFFNANIVLRTPYISLGNPYSHKKLYQIIPANPLVQARSPLTSGPTCMYGVPYWDPPPSCLFPLPRGAIIMRNRFAFGRQDPQTPAIASCEKVEHCRKATRCLHTLYSEAYLILVRSKLRDATGKLCRPALV